jgi:hypothetical protein
MQSYSDRYYNQYCTEHQLNLLRYQQSKGLKLNPEEKTVEKNYVQR